jgi:hypothetical protein
LSTNAGPLGGAWKVAVKKASATSEQAAKTCVVLNVNDGKLTVKDLAQGIESTGKTDGKQIELPINVQLPGQTSPQEVVLKGTAGPGGLSGTVEIGSTPYKWTATRLTSLWECGNHHTPCHVASSESEMLTYTKDKKCKGWHPVQLDSQKKPDDVER